MGRSRRLERFVAAVTLVGLIVVGVTMLSELHSRARPAVVWELAILVVVGEMVPLRVPFRGGGQEVTLSTTFVFALLLLGSPAIGLLAQVTASAASDLVGRKAWWKTLFNLAQYAIAVAAAAAILRNLGSHPISVGSPITIATVMLVFASGVTLYLVNTLLIGAAIGLSEDIALGALLRDDMPFQAAVMCVLLSQAPLLVVALQRGHWLVPLFAPAVGAAYAHGRAAIQREHDATHDALTGLANRTFVQHQIKNELGTSQHVAVLLIGFDRFREVNDTLGHAMGDRLLVESGRRLRERFEDVGVVARLGGDMFVVVAQADAAALRGLADLVLDTFAAPFDLDGLAFRLQASVGAAFSPDHGVTAELLTQHAEVAMYVAKERRSRFEAYAPTIDRYGPRRLALLGELAEAVDADQLVVHYQPIARLDTGLVTGAEALVRWRHPELGLVPPDHFIALAEASGTIVALTEFVARRAIEDCAAWRRGGHDLSVAVNLSPLVLHQPNLPDELLRLLDEHALPGSALKIEITENGAMRDPDLAREILGRLREHGIQIALDDFGTGHSSLAYLRRLPVDIIKIDKSFVFDMLTSDDDKAIVVSMIELAHSLGLTIVAEGVECETVWDSLLHLRADAAQGYYLSRPIPHDEFVEWLGAHIENSPSLSSAVQ